MTQALINNLNDLQNSLMQGQQSKKDLSTVTNPGKDEKDFSKIIDSQIDKTTKPSTLGDLKNSLINNDKLADFKKILEKATGEANEETALDLTLARDISEIINQLKEGLEDSTEESNNIPDTVAENTTADVVMVELPEQQVEVDTKVDVSNVELANVDTQNIPNETLQDVAAPIMSEKILETDTKVVIEDAVKVYDKQTAKSTSEITDADLGLDEGVLEDLNIESISAETEGNSGNEDFSQEQSPEELAMKTIIEKDKEHNDKKFDIKISAEQEVTTSQAPATSSEESVVTPTVGDAQPIGAATHTAQVQHTPATEISPSKIIEQITKQLEKMHNTSKVNIVLNPASLGKVTIEIAKSAEGMSAQFTVATQEAREILMKGLDGLKETLLSHGVNADNVNVKLNDTQKSEYKQDWTEQEGSKGGNKEQSRQNKEKQKGLFEKMMAQAEHSENGNV
ncbi:MAG: flagellar hook-length control protein FliK [bacterium]|nr:flagellar hook-length control protein FliK [bacterium]